ncbi:MAG: methionine adenosyltransferase [Methermicoccaceae archaeon]
MKNIEVEVINQVPMEEQRTEIVERKGIGHPDSVADGIAEAMSRALCAEYKKRFGVILHHNTDETQIVAGESKPMFGGGEIISPIYILLVGRATKELDGDIIPTNRVVVKAARDYLHENFPNLLDEYVIIDCSLGVGSSDLRDVFNRRERAPLANDTSFGVGYAPLSETETLVYSTERFLIEELRKEMPAIGEDIKVMASRRDDKISLTVACAMIDKYVDGFEHYMELKHKVQHEIEAIVPRYTKRDVNVFVNTADNMDKGSCYLTVTGTSAEMGDDGSVGRGNRCNGLITPFRPMSMEATSGKNPLNHVGKLYNLLSNKMASDIAESVEGVREVYVRLLSQIGKPINEPLVASVQFIPERDTDISRIRRESEEIVDTWLDNISTITDMVAEGKLATF